MARTKPQFAPAIAPLWHANDIQQRPLATLIPYARNARTHSPDQVRQLAASIQEFGFTTPVLIDADGIIIAGHGRVLAAEQLGLGEVPCITAPEDWSDAKRRAYTLADNKLALNAGWDADLLRVELAELDALVAQGALSLDLAIIGFSPEDLARLHDDADQAALASLASGEDDGETAPAGEGTAASGQDELTAFSTPISHDDLTVVHTAIRAAKRLHGSQTTGEALTDICRSWLEDREPSA